MSLYCFAASLKISVLEDSCVNLVYTEIGGCLVMFFGWLDFSCMYIVSSSLDIQYGLYVPSL